MEDSLSVEMEDEIISFLQDRIQAIRAANSEIKERLNLQTGARHRGKTFSELVTQEARDNFDSERRQNAREGATLAGTGECPRSMDNVTNDWLAKLTGADRVISFEKTVAEFGVSGYSDAFVVSPKYAGGNKGPRSILLKFAKETESVRAAAMAVNAYGKEARFYKELADKVSIRIPKQYGIFQDKELPKQFSCLALEDFTEMGEAGDQLTGYNFNESIDLCVAVGKMHGKFMGEALLGQEWLNMGEVHAPKRRISIPWNTGWIDSFLDDPQGNIDELIDVASAQNLDPFCGEPHMLNLMELVTGPKAVPLFEKMCEKLASRPKTLLHGNLRADIIIKSTGQEGASESDEYSFVDWQSVCAGAPGLELVELLQGNLGAATDYARIEELLTQYHGALVTAAGDSSSSSYTYDMLVEDYACGCVLRWFSICAKCAGVLNRTPPGTGFWLLMQEWWPRAAQNLKAVKAYDRVSALHNQL